MSNGPYDPRAVANLILDEAERREIAVSNLALQKLLYFAHGLHLITTDGRPLVTGYFEAWQYGPVHPAVYRAFKSAGSDTIKDRAVKTDPLTGARSELTLPSDIRVQDLIHDVVKSYGPMAPGRLVELSHAKNAPWATVADKARTGVALGMRISDDLIIERFRHHKISVGLASRTGEPPCDDTPFA